MREGLLPALLIAVTSLPALLLAQRLTGNRRRLATLLRLAALAMLAGALGLVWAGGDERRTLVIALGMAVAVNAVALFVLRDALLRRQRK